ncbi:LOW QUALITY PROTEIN: membrane protein [Bacillus sp. JCM 19045]|nr:LOW QUALITY PROTEIN: membrane protein [Bacillus sp. JCM 19045]
MFVPLFLEVIFPILLLIGLGAFLQRRYQFPLTPFSTLLTVCFMPAAVFLNMYRLSSTIKFYRKCLFILLLFTLATVLLSHLLGRILKVNDGEGAALKNSISLMNSGNFGLPVSQMVFSANPLGVTIQIFVLVFQNLLTYTYGLYNLLAATKTFKDILRSLIKLPIIHALILGLCFQLFQIPLPRALLIPLDYLSAGFISLALLLLGAQLANIRIRVYHKIITWAVIGRLVAGPALSLLIIYLIGLDGVVAQSLFIASSFPTSRNTSTMAMQYQVEPELHAQVVLYTTLLSSITVTLVIFLSSILF